MKRKGSLTRTLDVQEQTKILKSRFLFKKKKWKTKRQL